MSHIVGFPADGLATSRIVLRTAGRGDAEVLRSYYLTNRAHLKPWEPSRPDDFYALPSLEARLQSMEREMETGSALHLLLTGAGTGQLIGECNFTNIVRGPFLACHLGFSIDRRSEGQRLMHEGLTAALDYVFGGLRLHRIMANYRPGNVRSARLLEGLGFVREGVARAYLKIDGVWADHVLTSLINPADI